MWQHQQQHHDPYHPSPHQGQSQAASTSHTPQLPPIHRFEGQSQMMQSQPLYPPVAIDGQTAPPAPPPPSHHHAPPLPAQYHPAQYQFPNGLPPAMSSNGGMNGRYALPPQAMNAPRQKKDIKRRTKTGCLTCRKRRIKVSSFKSLRDLCLVLGFGGSGEDMFLASRGLFTATQRSAGTSERPSEARVCLAAPLSSAIMNAPLTCLLQFSATKPIHCVATVKRVNASVWDTTPSSSNSPGRRSSNQPRRRITPPSPKHRLKIVRCSTLLHTDIPTPTHPLETPSSPQIFLLLTRPTHALRTLIPR